jgi:hypothetical protein
MTVRMSHDARKTQRFYEQALSEAEQADLGSALDVQGFDAEIAALRLRLRTALKDQPEDLALVLRGFDVLRRMVATKYGLTREERDALNSAYVEETLRRLVDRAESGDDVDAA